MSLLSPDFHQRAREKRDRLLARRAAPSVRSDRPPPDGESILGDDLQADEAAASLPPEDDTIVSDKIVSLKEVTAAARTRGTSKDPPASLQELEGPQDLGKLTLDGLKRLAKASGVELPKPLVKAKLVAALEAVYRSHQQHGDAGSEASEATDQEDAAPSSTSCVR